MRHQSLLAYAKYRWAKIAIVVVIAEIVAYAFDRSPHDHYGGSALGYTLGTIGALLIVWLTWFGVRKRRYSSTSGTLLGGLSAHVSPANTSPSSGISSTIQRNTRTRRSSSSVPATPRSRMRWRWPSRTA